jgi:hypothetical protein
MHKIKQEEREEREQFFSRTRRIDWQMLSGQQSALPFLPFLLFDLGVNEVLNQPYGVLDQVAPPSAVEN